MAEFKTAYFVYDLETGGLSEKNNPIIEVAIVILNQNMEVIGEYNNFVKQYGDLQIQPQALQANNISLSQIASGIDIKELVTDIIELGKLYKYGRNKPILVVII